MPGPDELAKKMAERQYKVEVGEPQMEVEVGTPEILSQSEPEYSVEVGMPEIQTSQSPEFSVEAGTPEILDNNTAPMNPMNPAFEQVEETPGGLMNWLSSVTPEQPVPPQSSQQNRKKPQQAYQEESIDQLKRKFEATQASPINKANIEYGYGPVPRDDPNLIPWVKARDYVDPTSVNTSMMMMQGPPAALDISNLSDEEKQILLSILSEDTP